MIKQLIIRLQLYLQDKAVERQLENFIKDFKNFNHE